jgi:hypothetical protein
LLYALTRFAAYKSREPVNVGLDAEHFIFCVGSEDLIAVVMSSKVKR